MIKDKDKDLVRFSRERTITLPTGIKVKVVAYTFKDDPRCYCFGGRCGQMNYRNIWDVIRWG